ncbi:APC family permease [Actinomycetospora cinnamomea]|uniref:Amino acid/polyamine/organocation transporter (APC superfamily) n=1 Tax=Actinomycetospora cinnamomea TaxID=663609 RepID=A0A2U1EU58_9PSEU|nr:amino acid/polyamine/organocation transporter (APC superfamily) [Actinomycetospora cinnamomea]
MGAPGPAAWLRRKPVTAMAAETGADATPGHEGGELQRSIGLGQLAAIGIGATVGTGIFFVLSEATPEAGPAVVVSFVLAAITAGLTALCYAELASAVPVSGSSYSYAYATLGEAAAMGVAACLILEYLVSSAAVSVGWSEYLNALLESTVGIRFPEALSGAPGAGGVFNLPAVVLVLLCTVLLVRGVRESATANAIMVVIKLAVLLLFVGLAFTAFSVDNFADFAPLGVGGVGAAAGTVFFSFIGLDAVSTAGEEVYDPRRTLPRALVLALVVVTAVYLLVAVSALGAQPWPEFEGQEAGLAAIMTEVTGSAWPAIVIAAGAVISIFSVTLVTMYAQTRILFSMSRDGMLPPVLSRVSPRTLTPVPTTLIVGTGVAVLAGLVPLDVLADLVSIGTLVAFTVVSIGVIVLRRTAPDLPRGFRVPGYPVTPILSIVACLYLVSGLSWITWIVFVAWVAVVLLFWAFYGARHSRLARTAGEVS